MDYEDHEEPRGISGTWGCEEEEGRTEDAGADAAQADALMCSGSSEACDADGGAPADWSVARGGKALEVKRCG
jgi:hypothetical protein